LGRQKEKKLRRKGKRSTEFPGGGGSKNNFKGKEGRIIKSCNKKKKNQKRGKGIINRREAGRREKCGGNRKTSLGKKSKKHGENMTLCSASKSV